MEIQIRMALVYAGITQKQLGKQLGMSLPSFNAKLKRDTWTVSELQQIAKALNCEFVSFFRFKDDKII
ncbi:MAG: helix-turn-helix domain-containing protein [Coriobacteriales bacterium]|jgi:transcriptional regulator with XRE-family HTH domain|nr:helix-turn-helix domain-containing protein [Coriobacteriales bacterium]